MTSVQKDIMLADIGVAADKVALYTKVGTNFVAKNTDDEKKTMIDTSNNLMSVNHRASMFIEMSIADKNTMIDVNVMVADETKAMFAEVSHIFRDNQDKRAGILTKMSAVHKAQMFTEIDDEDEREKMLEVMDPSNNIVDEAAMFNNLDDAKKKTYVEGR
jgi:hypothetical protein